MDSTPPDFSDALRYQEAAYWHLMSQDGTVTDVERRELIHWLRQSPENIAALLRIRTIEQQLRELPPDAFLQRPALGRGPRTEQEHRGQAPPESRREYWIRTSIITSLEQTPAGSIITCNPLQLSMLVEEIHRYPPLVYQLHWRTWEEVVAAAYDRAGFDVVLTPRSGDQGRDIIATRHDFGAIRIFDQVKALSAHRKVTSADVLAMLGVLEAEGNVSKAFVTTTGCFAPSVFKDERLQRLMPFRLELRGHDALLQWLLRVQQVRYQHDSSQDNGKPPIIL